MSDRYTAPYEPDPFDDRPQQNEERTVPMRPITAAEMRLDPTKLARPSTSDDNPPRITQRRRITLIAIIAGVLVVALIGVSIVALSGNHHSSQTRCATCAAATMPATATTAPEQPTAVTITSCGSVTGFAQAGAAATNSTNFLGVAFLPNTVAQTPVASESNGFQSRTLLACTPAITSAASLQASIGSGLATKGWQPTTPPANNASICATTGCWNQADTSTIPATMQYISLDAITIIGSVATYALRLTISPLFTKTGMTMPSNTTFSFEQTPRAELQWDTKLHTIASNNVIGTQLAANSYATTTYAVLSQHIASFGPLPDIPIAAGTGCALQGTAGFYIKFIIQAASPGQITLDYVVYPYGF